MNRDRCIDPSIKYRPQWPRVAPKGLRYESHWVPFTFPAVPMTGQLVRQLPVQLEDDQPFIVTGIWFPQIGMVNGVNAFGSGLCRIWDTRGNPLSNGLVLGLGQWCNAGLDGFGNSFAPGWPIEDALECDPGSTLFFDFQLYTNAGVAVAAFFGVLESVQFFAGVYGVAGNGRTIELIDPGAPNVPLSIAILPDGVSVQVTLATDGGGVITTTYMQLYQAFLADASLVGVMVCHITGTDPNEVVAAGGPQALMGGTASLTMDLFGVLLGVKVFEDC
jgi:hypothetical protein